METHKERIRCPNCEVEQVATVEHTWPWHTRVHECDRCKYLIMESEWNTLTVIENEQDQH